MSADLVLALVTLLKADAGVAALVGTRVFGEELPAGEAVSMPRHAVVMRPSGGVSLAAGSTMEHDTQRIDALAYGPTAYEADRLRRAVHDLFKPLRRVVVTVASGNVLLHWIEPAGGWVSQRDPDFAWPLSFQSWQAFYAEQAAA